MKIKAVLGDRALLREMALYAEIGGAAPRWMLSYIICDSGNGHERFSRQFYKHKLRYGGKLCAQHLFQFPQNQQDIHKGREFFRRGLYGAAAVHVVLFIGSTLMVADDFAVKIVSIIIVAAFQFIMNKVITFGKIK
jgi:hypothetical protein